MFNSWLFKQIDNSALIVFRILFGILITLESFGAILTGWVKDVLITPKFNFTFIGFEWLQLPESWIYPYYIIMGVFGVLVTIGYKYRFSMLAFAILWTGTYLMQKSSYNNHYYLMVLLSFIMVFLPAHNNYSVDAKKNSKLFKNSMPQWCSLVFVIQMLIVYTYASIAKLYPDWLDTSVVEILLKRRRDYFIIGSLMDQQWFHYFIAYSGIIFDLLIVPLLLWRTTRKYAFITAIFFHLFNSVVFHIGVFPFMSLALCVFFFEPKTIRNIFLKKKELYGGNDIVIPKRVNLVRGIIGIYVIWQVLMPLRHWVIKDNVLWTEEGHRMSWRMMLRSKSGMATYKVVNKATRKEIKVNLRAYLTNKQLSHVATKPDFIWQFSQYLKKKFKEENNMDVAVYADCKIRVNGRSFQQLTDTSVDLASVKWNAFKHHHWILPSKLD
jgi:uncharacterized membrane protein YphA (DoxX/SURF4 family)